MSSRARFLSKSSNRSRSTRNPKQLKLNQEAKVAVTMDTLDSVQPNFSFPSNFPRRYIDRVQDPTHWIAAKNTPSYEAPSYAPGQLCMTESDAPYMTDDMPTTSGVSQDNAIPMESFILDQGQSFMSNELYQFADASEASIDRSQTMFDTSTIDPSIDLSITSYPEFNALTIDMFNNCFKADLVSGSISYDSSSSIYMSPPVSPELGGQTFSGLPNDYSINGDYASQGTTNVLSQQFTGFSQRPSSPLSPPMSEGDSLSVFASDQQLLSRSQPFIEACTLEVDTCKNNIAGGLYRDPEPALPGTSARISSSTSQSCTQISRPAQRVLKPASEKPREQDQDSQVVPISAYPEAKEKPETNQPRNHYLYKVLPGEDGLFRCPFAEEKLCAHLPTKQKCGYE